MSILLTLFGIWVAYRIICTLIVTIWLWKIDKGNPINRGPF